MLPIGSCKVNKDSYREYYNTVLCLFYIMYYTKKYLFFRQAFLIRCRERGQQENVLYNLIITLSIK